MASKALNWNAALGHVCRGPKVTAESATDLKLSCLVRQDGEAKERQTNTGRPDDS